MILLTGATGLLGAHLLDLGLAGGKTFRVVARNVPARSYLATVRARVEVAPLDLTSGEIPVGIFRGVESVIHAAGLASSRPEDADAMAELHIGSTVRLAEHAALAGVRRWIQVSSVATLDGRDTPYARSKAEGDRRLDSMAASGRFALLTVHPTFMLGAWDSRPSSGAFLAALRLGVLRHVVRGTKNIASARGVARGILQALDRGAHGHYVLGGVDVDMLAFVEEALPLLGLETGVRPLEEMPHAPLPGMQARELALLRELCSSNSVSSAKATGDFGYDPSTDPGTLLRETLSYFEHWNILKPKRPRSGVVA